MIANGYSIWLIPPAETFQKLSKIIFALSKKYSVPDFEPHITLIGNLIGHKENLISKTLKLAEQLKSFEIKLKKADYFDEYFRCLFIRAERSKEVAEANKIARETFNLKPDPEYMPHLSLLYGNFSTKTKGRIIAEIGREFNISFEVNSIHLYLTESEVNDWCKVKEFSLK